MILFDCYCNSRPDWKVAPVPCNKLLILGIYFYSGDDNFISSIVSCGELTVEKDVGRFIEDDSYAIESPR